MLICVAFISCERDDMKRPDEQNGRPIEFVVESEWPEMTKSLISNSDDIKGVGFKVWGVKSSDSDGSNSESVFGEDGTSVLVGGPDRADRCCCADRLHRVR